MEINRGFVNLLIEEKLTAIHDLLGDQGLGIIVRGEKTLDSIEHLDEILYTVDFLEREKLILINGFGNMRAPHVGDCLKYGLEDTERGIRHLMDTNKKLEELYGKEIKTNFKIYDFVKNGYKTDFQKERVTNFWLPICIAIGTTMGVSLLTVLFERIFLCN